MTARTSTVSTAPAGDVLRRLSLRPVEGWLTLLPTALMVVVFAFSLVDAGWTPGSAGDAGFLPWVGLIGLAFGVFGAKVGWGRWRTHLVGALFAGLILPLVVGGVVLHDQVGWDPHGLAERLVASLGIAQRVWNDFVVLNRQTTLQYAHYHLIFGAIVWGAGQLAGFTVFGHHRPLDAVVVLGLAILANMALTSHDQTSLTLLVLFSAAALLLLIRTHVFEEQVTWTRRKIGDPAAVGQLYLRGGAAFVTAAVLGSILLTATASSAPLQGMWADLPSKLQAVSQWLLRFAPTGGDFRPTGAISFGSEATTRGVWTPSSAIAFRAQLLPQEGREFKWRAGTYADYTTFGWVWGTTRDVPTAARDLLQGAPGDAPTAVGRRELRYRITTDGYRDPTILGPNRVQWVDRPATAVLRGVDGWFTTVTTDDSPDTYNASAMIPVLQDVQGGLTEARLRIAGTDYPAELKAIYTALPSDPAALGPASTALLDAIRAAVRTPPGADPGNAYDLVRTMETYLRSADHFTYDEDVLEEVRTQCDGVSTVECFAIIKQGYCEYYASTMAVLLRASGIPARIAYGFLHGARDAGGLEVVPGSAAHWWVEVFFPGTGWVEFDPTGGGIGQIQPIPSGSVGPPTSRPSQAPAIFREPTTPPSAFTPTGPGGSGIGPFIAIAIILAIGVGALVFASYRRTPNKPMHPDQAWGSVARLASRFGLGPRPSQTVYEYAGSLGDTVPAARIELTTIARAKVEVAYGKRDLGTDRLKRIAQAYHRLRFAILGFVLRRGLRRRKR